MAKSPRSAYERWYPAAAHDALHHPSNTRPRRPGGAVTRNLLATWPMGLSQSESGIAGVASAHRPRVLPMSPPGTRDRGRTLAATAARTGPAKNPTLPLVVPNALQASWGYHAAAGRQQTEGGPSARRDRTRSLPPPATWSYDLRGRRRRHPDRPCCVHRHRLPPSPSGGGSGQRRQRTSPVRACTAEVKLGHRVNRQ